MKQPLTVDFNDLHIGTAWLLAEELEVAFPLPEEPPVEIIVTWVNETPEAANTRSWDSCSKMEWPHLGF